MATTFRMEVERFKAELVQQVQPGTGAVDVHLPTTTSSEQEMAAGAASGEIDAMLQRPVVLHFADGGRVEWRKEAL